MKSKSFRLLVLSGLLFGMAVAIHAWLSPTLPRIKLQKGGELRVLKASYGNGANGDHDLEPAPKWKSRVWPALPKRLQSWITPPQDRFPGYPEDVPGVSVFWRLSSPAAPLKVMLTLDSGEERILNYVCAVGDLHEVIIMPPPRDSRRLRFFVPTGSGESLSFAVNNPAYQQP